MLESFWETFRDKDLIPNMQRSRETPLPEHVIQCFRLTFMAGVTAGVTAASAPLDNGRPDCMAAWLRDLKAGAVEGWINPRRS
jgi:hypothetical protein